MKRHRNFYMFVMMLLAAVTGCEEAAGESYSEMRIQSAGFGDQEAIPVTFTCKGSGLSPPLSFSPPPADTKSLAVIMDEPEHIAGTYTHWLVYALPPKSVLNENAGKYPTDGMRVGTADDEKTIGYLPPCPPEGKTHRFVFTVYALDREITLDPGASRDALDHAMAGHIVAKGALTGVMTGR
jgi:Raf kinase inhibitor-like YbhB/YbcL family protein